MLKKTIVYTNFNDEQVSEDYYFHLSKAELIELEMSYEGGLSESLKEIVASEDGKAIIAEFKNIILMSYGQRSADGKRFIKNQLLREEFESSEAYSTLFVELVTDADAAAKFISGIIPSDMAEEAVRLSSQAIALSPVPTPEEPKETITKADLMNLPKEEFVKMQEQISSGKVELIQ